VFREKAFGDRGWQYLFRERTFRETVCWFMLREW
jgi:hypothetical protein